MKIAGKDLLVADASRLAHKYQLAAVHVSGLKARTIPGADSTASLGWVLLPIDMSWGAVENQVRAVVPVSLHIFRDENGERGAAVAEVGVLLRLDYHIVEPGESDEAIASFVGISGCMHAWPYVRAELQHLSTKLELAPFLLPSLVSGEVANVVNSVALATDETKPGKRAAARKPKRRPLRT